MSDLDQGRDAAPPSGTPLSCSGQPRATLMLDVDGVLVSSRGDWAARIERDLGISGARLRAHFFKTHWPGVITGRQGLRDALAEALPVLGPRGTPPTVPDTGLLPSADQVIAYWFARDGQVVAPVLQDLIRLRTEGHTVWLATNQEDCRARFLMQDLGLGAHVDGMVHSAALGARKPDPAFYAHAAAHLGQPASALFLVDDRQDNVDAARRAGWRAARWTGRAGLHALVSARLGKPASSVG